MISRDSRPIWEAYADADLAHACTTCFAPANTWCTRSDGRVRRVPCFSRTKTHTERPTP